MSVASVFALSSHTMNPFDPPTAQPDAPSDTIVRHCPSCGAPAAVSVRDWPIQHTFMGVIPGGSGGIAYQDFCCQDCAYVWRPRTTLRSWFMPLMAGILGAPLALLGVIGLADGDVYALILLLVFGGGGGALLYFGGLRHLITAWRGSIAVGAQPPAVRYTNPEPARRCRCGKPAACIKVVENSTNGIPSGTDRTYQCPSCGHTFEIESPLGILASALGSLLLFGIAAVGIPDSLQEGDWTMLACSSGLGLMGLVLVWSAGANVIGQIQHPVVKPDEG